MPRRNVRAASRVGIEDEHGRQAAVPYECRSCQRSEVDETGGAEQANGQSTTELLIDCNDDVPEQTALFRHLVEQIRDGERAD